MTETRHGNLEITDASRSDILSLVSPGAPSHPEARNGAALSLIPTFEITSKDTPSDADTPKGISCHQSEINTRLTTNNFCTYKIGRDRVNKIPWLVPHTAKEQKRMWHQSYLAIGEK
jgi:hypothetical protein